MFKHSLELFAGKGYRYAEYYYAEWQGRIKLYVCYFAEEWHNTEDHKHGTDCTYTTDSIHDIHKCIEELESNFIEARCCSDFTPKYCDVCGQYFGLVEYGEELVNKGCMNCEMIERTRVEAEESWERDYEQAHNEKRHRERETGCFVYLMQCMGVTKIGIARDVKKRLAGIQTSHFSEVKVIHKKRYSSRYKAQQKESELHSLLSENRLKGEWFDLSGKSVRDLVEGELK